MGLTLTRRVGEKIKIGDDIEIEVREIRRNACRIGITAPSHVKIDRAEADPQRPLTTARTRAAQATTNVVGPEHDEILQRIDERQRRRQRSRG